MPFHLSEQKEGVEYCCPRKEEMCGKPIGDF